MKIVMCAVLLCFAALGVNARNMQKRIAGGEVAKIAEFPHHALFALDGKIECSGALLSEFHVLLAAHCFLKIFGKITVIMAVFLGSMLPFSGQPYSIIKISYHKDFSPDFKNRFRHDIGMIHLDRTVDYSLFVAPINLPPDNEGIEKRTSVTVTGFGESKEKQKHFSRLIKLKTKTLSLEECKPFFEKDALNDSNVCTWDRPGVGCLNGDGGAPLVESSTNLLLGILAGTDHSANGNPDVYTKVSHYKSFIREEIKWNIRNRESSTEHPAIYFTKATPQYFPGEKSGPRPLHYEHRVLEI